MKIKSIVSLALFTSSLYLSNAAKLAASPPVGMKILILAEGQDDSGYVSISTYLKQLGTPYDVTFLNNVSPDSSGNRLTSVNLIDSTGNGLYQGIIQTDGSFTTCNTRCKSLLSTADWTKLQNYEVQYQVRVVAYNTNPDATWGLVAADSGAAYTQANPLNVTLTQAGTTVFSYLNAANAIPVGGAGNTSIWGYRATTTAAANETTTPLLVNGNYTIAVTHTTADGRETMAFTVDNYPGLIHSTAFAYGVINWVTKGVFLGSRRVYLNTQIDDLLLGNRLYAPTRPECPNDSSCPTIFATAQDLNTLSTWQTALQADPLFQSYRTTYAFNGVGTTWYAPSDPIFPAITALNPKFRWVSHTWDHSNLDCFSKDANGACVPMTVAQSLSELTQNIDVAPSLGFAFDRTSMVTPFNGGVNNANFMQAAAQLGLQYIITSDDPPGPNLGSISAFQPSILLVPRRGNNLFDDASTPQTGVYGSWPDEYNAKFGPNGTTPLYNEKLTYAQIIDIEGQLLLQNDLLTYEPYPLGYHIDNSSTYDGTHSMFTDLMESAIAKYKKIFNLPVVTLDMSEIGQVLMNRASYNASGVTGIYYPGVGVKLTTTNTAVIPVTGACAQALCSNYGGQVQDSVTLSAGASVTLSLSATEGAKLRNVTVNPATVAAGLSSTGTVFLTNPAPAGGVAVALTSSNTSVTLPVSVTVPAGSTSVPFNIAIAANAVSVTPVIEASYQDVTESATLTISGSVALASVSVSSSSFTGGSPLTGTVTLSGAAPASGIAVNLTSNSPAVTVPASITVAAGSTGANFTIQTQSVSTTTSAMLTATHGGINQTATLTITAAPTTTLAAVSANAASVTGGTSSTGTVAIGAPAPAGGVTIDLWTNGSPAFVPTGVTIAAGATTATFDITTVAVSTSMQGTITAFYNGVMKTATITVTPAMVIANLAGVSVSPTSVKAGSTSTGTVTLSAPAPTGGMTIDLWTNGSPAFVPTGVTVSAGATTATFTVTTISSVSTSTQGTITAFYKGQMQTATINITP